MVILFYYVLMSKTCSALSGCTCNVIEVTHIVTWKIYYFTHSVCWVDFPAARIGPAALWTGVQGGNPNQAFILHVLDTLYKCWLTESHSIKCGVSSPFWWNLNLTCSFKPRINQRLRCFINFKWLAKKPVTIVQTIIVQSDEDLDLFKLKSPKHLLCLPISWQAVPVFWLFGFPLFLQLLCEVSLIKNAGRMWSHNRCPRHILASWSTLSFTQCRDILGPIWDNLNFGAQPIQ